MSDGITEARRGTYFNGASRYESKQDPALKNSWEYKDTKVKNVEHMPNQKWHKYVSFIKSGVRIVGYGLIPFNLVAATIVLIFSEIIGIVEELV